MQIKGGKLKPITSTQPVKPAGPSPQKNALPPIHHPTVFPPAQTITLNEDIWRRLSQPRQNGFVTAPAHLINRRGAEIVKASSEQASEAAMANFFNIGITALNGSPKAGNLTEKYLTEADTFFHWLYMRPGTSDYSDHGFFIPKGSTLELSVKTVQEGDHWRRSVSFNVKSPPDNFGMFGPIALDSNSAPVGESRISKIIFTQNLDDAGKVLSEKSEMGLTFSDKSGHWRDPSFLEKKFWLDKKEKSGELRREKINGKTLYIVDVSESFGGLWKQELKRLQQTVDLHEKRTGEKIELGSVANRMAYFKFIFLLGLRSAASDGADARRVAAARKIAGLN